MNGNNLTRFTPQKRYYHGDPSPPRDLEHPVAQGEIAVVRRAGRQVTLNPPIQYKVWKVVKTEYTGITYAFQAETLDTRLGELPRNTYYHSDDDRPRPYTSKGDPADTIQGAIASFRIKASKHITSFSFKHETITVEEYEVKPIASREGIADAIGLALRVFHTEGKGEWGLHYGQVAVGGRLMDMVHAVSFHSIHGYEFKSCRADWTSDKKWRDYLQFCHRLTFITVPGAIRADELPEEVGLYYLNQHFRPVGSIRRTKEEMALMVVRAATKREIQDKHWHEMASRLMVSRGVPIVGGDPLDQRLYAALAKIYGEESAVIE